MSDAPPLILHAVYRLDIGGLENGLVNLINHLPAERYRHAIVCLEGFSAAFRERIERDDTEIFTLEKQPGKDLGLSARLFRLLRQMRPAVLHTRNLGTLECQFVAAAAGVARRIHGEHGWDVVDLHGDRLSYVMLRRASRLVVHKYIPMSAHLARWLHDRIGIPAKRISQVYNGVDADRFRPAVIDRRGMLPPGFADDTSVVIGTVGRLSPVKDQLTLVRAFARLLEISPSMRERLRLILVGEGPLSDPVKALTDEVGIGELCLMMGPRDDIPELMRSFDVFALPSLNEGISNTILEAMASALPIVATSVGGNVELVQDGKNGTLCEPQNPDAMADALRRYIDDEGLRHRHGSEGRRLVTQDFTLTRMVERYAQIYDELLARS